MLKVRLMGTKNDIVWFQKILQRHPKVEVLEISELYNNKGTNKYYRAYAEVQKSNVKTTTTSNLGIGLAKQGKKVLLIDADAQGSLTASLGFAEPDAIEISLATVMGSLIKDEEVEPMDGVLHHEEGIDLMPGNIELSGLEVSLVNVMSRERNMQEYIGMVRDYYDYILIDCMPSLGMITINAFACADSILIPVQAAYLPVKGLQQLIKTIGKVKR